MGVSAVDAFAAESPCFTHDFSGQVIANSMWALAKMQHEKWIFTIVIQQLALSDVKKFYNQELSNMAWALSTTLTLNEVLVGVTFVEHVSEGYQFDPQECSNI